VDFLKGGDLLHPCRPGSKLRGSVQVLAQQQGGGPAAGASKAAGPPSRGPQASQGGSQRKQPSKPSSRKPNKQGKPAGRVSVAVCKALCNQGPLDPGFVLTFCLLQYQTTQQVPAPGWLHHLPLDWAFKSSSRPTLQPHSAMAQEQSNPNVTPASMLVCLSRQHPLLGKPSKQQLTWQP
jgi:hypothetical protein